MRTVRAAGVNGGEDAGQPADLDELTGDEIQFLASPVTGGGIPLSRAERLFLGAWHRGARTPNDWVKAATEAPLPVGTPVPQLLKEALYFQTRLPGLRALGLIGQES